MELFSQSFIRALRQTLDSSSCTILGTIPVPKGKPLGLVEEVRSRRDVKVFTVSKNIAALTGLKHKEKEIFGSKFELVSLTIATGQCLHCIPLVLGGQKGQPCIISLSCSRIKSKSCMTDSTTMGCLKCQNNF
ncbi:hypothetical protein XENOCAPTIV_018266 [Xenoophorus captivus]|uniref:Uncharacterized protein n=1 Tax=Xenoophorus captivus TaxID=1517983 RepID=A0ABV0SHP8_9TELE